MRDGIHPKYQEAEVRCACGNSFKTRSARPVIVLGICNVCHPFYTGQQRLTSTAGKAELFKRKYGEYLKKDKQSK